MKHCIYFIFIVVHFLTLSTDAKSSEILEKEKLFSTLKFPKKATDYHINDVYKPLLMPCSLDFLNRIAPVFPEICSFAAYDVGLLSSKLILLGDLDPFLFDCVMENGWYRWHPNTLGKAKIKIERVINFFEQIQDRESIEHFVKIILDASKSIAKKPKTVFKLINFTHYATQEEMNEYLKNPSEIHFNNKIYAPLSDMSKEKKKQRKERRRNTATHYQEINFWKKRLT